MTPDDEKAFELLHALRAIVAAWWVRARHTRIVDDRRQIGWREVRRLEELAFTREELPEGYAWEVPSDEDVAAVVLPPIETSLVHTLPGPTLDQCFDGRPARLLHLVTGDLRHFEEPVAWMSSRGWCVYVDRVVGRRIRLWRVARAGAWRVTIGDPMPRAVFARLCGEIWEEYLVASEWERAGDDESRRDFHPYRLPMRSPSGAVYALDAAVDIALLRGGFDVLAEFAKGDTAAARAVAKASPKVVRKGAGEEAAR
jgi:hypothetical protein